jgi:hypothetical protein
MSDFAKFLCNIIAKSLQDMCSIISAKIRRALMEHKFLLSEGFGLKENGLMVGESKARILTIADQRPPNKMILLWA